MCLMYILLFKIDRWGIINYSTFVVIKVYRLKEIGMSLNAINERSCMCFCKEYNRHDKIFFNRRTKAPFFSAIVGYGTVPTRSACPTFFLFSRCYPLRIYEPLGGFTRPHTGRHQTLVISVHPGLWDFQDFFSRKKSYIQVYLDRITRPARQKMTTIRIIFDGKKN